MTLTDFFNKVIVPKNRLKVLASILVPALFLILRPINLSPQQAVILGTLFLVIIWWATGWVQKDAASTVLIIVFLIFGQVSPRVVFNFPLSENLVMIIAAYLLSAGIVNSKIAEQFSDFCIRRFCGNGRRLAALSFILAALLIFIIPQPFPRVVLMAAIYINFLKKFNIGENEKSVFLFSIFAAATVTSLLFFNGDVIANYAAFGFAGITLSYTGYIRYMLLPTAAMSVLTFVAYCLAFRRELRFVFPREEGSAKIHVGKEGARALGIMVLVIALWLLEPLHHISAAKIAAGGVVLMFIFRIIGKKDLKTVNLSLIWFLTAEFAIGKTLVGGGTAEKIKDALLPLLPAVDSFWFLPLIVLIIMVLHMIMGSLITGLSFGIPMVMVLTQGYWQPEFAVMVVLCTVGLHYVMPFHHVTVMIGYGSGYFENRHTLKFGLWLTPLVLAAIFFIYLPWWKFTGIAP